MKAVILYHPRSEFARGVEEYARDFGKSRGQPIELVSLETVEGSDMAKLYDIVRYPALLIIKDDGQLEKNWEGETLPLMDEVAGYISS